MKKYSVLAIVLVTQFFIHSCTNDTSNPVNEEEVITTVSLTLTGGGQEVTLTSRDLDGDGADLPLIEVSGVLKTNTVYEGTVSILNETVSPSIDLTSEVREEGVDHQLFFQTPNTTLGTFTYNDTDTNGEPIGLEFKLETGVTPTSGTIFVTLKHLPNKSAAGVSLGDITNAGGATDADVSFPVNISN